MKSNATLFDLFLTGALVICVVSLFFLKLFFGKNGSTILIQTSKDKFAYSIDQKIVADISGDLGLTKIEIDNGKFRFLESPCKNKNCVNSGWVRSANFPVVCLPNRVSAYIMKEGDKDASLYDGVTR
ncbi:MAG TPA: NusG domain II-containing protein [Spirochaetota bacterium]|jgi:hypothetical protein|nr:MAG: hypothetical protein BWX91_02340 [Spirochaetes bacterium ADurb.Bin133]HNZ28058.1 NusG domain II-containing protein [Spirochaetota bacterium]HPY88683.1 NusG domain II-containing protein [Spirochaetota bacterium]HQB62532.1 NusG domain II-containing protein [Spirochaetota bacterium]